MKILFFVLFLHVTAFVPGSAAITTTEVELSISANKLKSYDLFSKSDPMCVVYTQSFDTKEWKEYFRTETINNNHDPVFVSKVHLLYNFEEQQTLKFELYDVDLNSSDLRKHDFLGFAVCNLGQIISNGTVQLQLQKKNVFGKMEPIESHILLSAEELTPTDDTMILQMNGQNLDKKDYFGKSDPFIEIHRSTESQGYVLVHKTEAIKRTLNPRWPRFVIPIKTLCNADYHRSLKFKCWDWNASGSHSLIGEFYTTLKELSEGIKTKFALIHEEKKQRKRNYKNSGEINVEYFQINKVYSFMDYLKGGLQIHCTIAIDFTASNGDPRFSTSRHYISGAALNSYEEGIIAVVPIIEDYDTDKRFPVLGFGARIFPDMNLSHEFFVNMDPSSPYCAGLEGVLNAYRACLPYITLAGPTNFAPVIEHVINFALQYNNGMNYFILLILTDGVITDMHQTINAIVKASALPISVIIVGVGDADFKLMNQLDNDGENPLESDNGQKAQRDIVQFVPFNKCCAHGDPRTVQRRLAKEVLAEIPKQLTGFMMINGFVPGPPKLNPIDLPQNPDLL